MEVWVAGPGSVAGPLSMTSGRNRLTGIRGLVFWLSLLASFTVTVSLNTDCKLLGRGACRGDGWSAGEWPVAAGKSGADACCQSCLDKEGCSSFSVSKSGDCLLFGHKKVLPASSLGGECYAVHQDAKAKTTPEVQPPTASETKPTPAPAKKPPVESPTPPASKPAKKHSHDHDDDDDDDDKKSKKSLKQKDDDDDDKKTQKSPSKKTDDDEDDKKPKKQVKNDDDDKKAKKPFKKEDDEDDNVKTKAEKAPKEAKKPVEPVVKPAPPKAKQDGGHEKVTAKQDGGHEKVTAKQDEVVKVQGKFVHLVGDGGCRGKDWKKSPWPVDGGRQTLAGCAQLCLSKSCTAFHRLHQDDTTGQADCLLFGHSDIFVVRGLGGQCHKLSDSPPPPPRTDKRTSPTVEDEGGDTEREVTGPVYMAQVGTKGRCRGPGWTAGRWPIPKGLMGDRQACAEACARRKGCTGFDTSPPPEEIRTKGGRQVECTLYGHARIEAAAGVPGNCYVLADKPGMVVDETGGAVAEQAVEEEEELEVSGEVDYHSLGSGRCRGSDWTLKNKWPVIKGGLIAKDCAVACAKKKGCTAFDIGVMSEDTEECALYGHKNVVVASGVKGNCFVLGKSDQTGNNHEEPEDEEEEEIDDGKTHKYVYLGRGMCRGANWQSKRWPAVRGMKSLQDCANSCGRKKGCTGFDTSKPDGKLFDCMLYGHKHLVPAPGVPGDCYSVVGGEYIEPEVPAQKQQVQETRSRAKILDEGEEDYTNIKDVELLGMGACRGQGWQDGIWPLPKGRKNLRDCATECKKTQGCVAFDISNKENEKYDCLLLGHPQVLPASGLAAKCYIIKGAKPDARTRKADDPILSSKDRVNKDSYPEGGFGFVKLGYGLCRGDGWQMNGWPRDEGEKSLKDCAGACAKTRGCRGFDLARHDEGQKFGCLLFGHTKISPASAVDGACYVPGAAKAQSAPEPVEAEEAAYEEEEDVIIDLEGDLDVALLGGGGCRGSGWQEGGWPKVKGFVTVDQCGALCVSTAGCTAFHVASPRESADGQKSKDQYECFLFGHKSVVPASGLPGNCYTVAKGSSSVVTRTSRPKQQPKQKKEKKYKVPEFDPPTVVADEFDPEDDEEWLFEPPPPEIRSRDHISQILGLSEKKNDDIHKVTESTLKELKKVYENSIKELEKLYKYKELSNRHFGDPEIFNKPLIVFMGPWSGGKSTIINYLLGIEYTQSAFRSSAEPSPGFNFNLAMYGDTEEEIDGTQLSAEWAFSSLQKFGQEFIKKIKGKKLPNKLLEKATFAEIPGVLETGTIRKIDRRYPFNDACQWFIDHADLIVLVYDYAKLDIGPETEALLDQLKGREQQVRIVLNKADEITAEELLKIQGNLVWNVSPLMASIEPPTLYAGSFWSKPYKNGAPKRLLKSQEQAFLKDIKEAIDKRVENRIATARRFAVRVRNHAKMVDCYLTTFKNNKGLFGDKKKMAQDIIENPGKYHIYEGLSALTNISRYDLPDPDTYRDFFNVHPLFDFPTLQSTCTFFKGCPLNKLDIAIAYDLPDILTTYKKKVTHLLAGGSLDSAAAGQQPRKPVKK